ncbi:uncharacterized protein TRAVEDRAFT_52939 [Trametes versicolor FP-101664 SS1]|uniref:uncharacterized protein n=1 Tax=Trametes versicolor (strain FP-101664) TaxID=717944 RepID=UPI000462179F|nr:uncharacterized protein TRAVEDRAFT_52939 [Trametes versicolor FP-101664 SS1]EIW52495.1 hypothetical protein TRAVEDRAFT_52939 [Trametes versicolor FP-101664 SS1]
MSPLPLTVRSWSYFVLSAVVFTLGLLLNFKAYTNFAAIGSVEWRSSDFSFLESDHPPTLYPLFQHPRDAAIVIEETVHYHPNNSREWSSMYPAGSEGFVRLGPQGRLFGVSMFRQLHCLDEMRRAMVEPPNTEQADSHVQHCLNHIRQMLLCASSVRLEAMKKDETLGENAEKIDGLGFEHQCRDWSLLWRKVEENYAGWTDEVGHA